MTLYKVVDFEGTVTINGRDYTAIVSRENIESDDEDFVTQCDDFDLQTELINQVADDNELDLDGSEDISLDIHIPLAIEA